MIAVGALDLTADQLTSNGGLEFIGRYLQRLDSANY